MKKILLLQNVTKDNSVINFSDRTVKDIQIIEEEIYRTDIPKSIIKLLRHSNKQLAKIALGDWKKCSKFQYDELIVMESDVTVSILKTIKDLYIAKKILLYFINAVNEKNINLMKYAVENHYTVATYNLEDSRKYNMRYIHQCWNKQLVPRTEDNKFKYDLFFVGRAKNRYHDIIKIKEYAESLGLTTKFIIVSDNKEPFTQCEELAYKKCLEEMEKARVIVDIVGKGNIGLTWRPLEALFMKKKLITNYLGIDQYDIYKDNKRNIFLLGQDDLTLLKSFVLTPFIDEGIDTSKYDIEEWIKNLAVL